MNKQEELKIQFETLFRFSQSFKADFAPLLQNIQKSVQEITSENIEENKNFILQNTLRALNLLDALEKQASTYLERRKNIKSIIKKLQNNKRVVVTAQIYCSLLNSSNLNIAEK